MQTRNAIRLPDGRIDCEVNHPVYGWIPFTADSADPAAADIFAALDATPDLPTRPAPAATGEDVNNERKRRIRIGKVFAVPGYGPVAVEGREEDMRNLGALGTAALAAIGAGAGAGTMQFRGADNTVHTLTWAQMFALWQLSTAYVSAVYAASWAIKDGGSVPADYAANSRWPA